MYLHTLNPRLVSHTCLARSHSETPIACCAGREECDRLAAVPVCGTVGLCSAVLTSRVILGSRD